MAATNVTNGTPSSFYDDDDGGFVPPPSMIGASRRLKIKESRPMTTEVAQQSTVPVEDSQILSTQDSVDTASASLAKASTADTLVVLPEGGKTAKLILENWQNGHVFVTGPGGTGKSYEAAIAAKEMLELGRNVHIVASTGVAAYELGQKIGDPNLPVKTIHSWAKIGVGIEPAGKSAHDYAMGVDDLLKKILGQASKYRADFVHLRECTHLMIEEPSMLSNHTLELVDKVLKMLRKSKKPFGGILVCFVGDFLQLPPVNKDRNASTPWIFKSPIWTEMDPLVITLSKPKRYPDVMWFKLLNRIRRGKQTKLDIKFLRDICDSGIPDFPEGTVRPTWLCPHVETADDGNASELKKIRSLMFTYVARDSVYDKRGNPIASSEKTAQIKMKQLDDLAPKKIELKVGAQVMLRKNIDQENGLVNGRRGIITDLTTESATVMFEGASEPTIVEVTKHEIKDDFGNAIRLQMPFTLAWYITIHKSQGVTLSSAILSLGQRVFAPAQAYVALSRVKTSEGLYLAEFSASSLIVDTDAIDYYDGLDG